MKELLKSAWAVVQENRRAYIVINIVYYGLVAIFMVVAAFNQPLQDQLLQSTGQAFMSGPLAAVGSAYANANILPGIGLTFIVNLLLGSFAEITLPSLIIPFSGFLMGILRAVLWGLILSPAHPSMRLIMIPHMLTLILEGQAYILALLATWDHGRAFLWPQTVGIEPDSGSFWQRHGRGYWEGLKRTGKIYILITLTLLVAAIYEVLEVVIMMKFMS
jgi:hypothetical protein